MARRKKVTPMFEQGDPWTEKLIERAYEECRIIADEELKLTYYPNQIEIINSSQMLDAYTSIGLPIMYRHWTFGKHFLQQERSYRKGYSGLAYEIVINSSPCISYLMENNSMTMQTLVTAHAAFGHNHFFKNNYLFKTWTDAEGILDYLKFAKNYIAKCEEKYGIDAVEELLDSCHALKSHGVDRYKRPPKLSKEKIELAKREREAQLQAQRNELWDKVIGVENKEDPVETGFFLKEPEENILYFLEKHSPILKPWQREVVRIVRKIAQYFLPQGQTKVMNEGTATFVHYYIMNRLWEKGLLTDGSYLEFLHSHSGVVFQPDYNDRRFSGFNPYYLGYNMFKDMKRICDGENITDEDREWFPDMVDTPWLDTFHFAVENFRDESFIRQYLSPKMMRENRMFTFVNDNSKDHYEISAIHNESGYKKVRQSLAREYNISRWHPDIQVWDANMRTDRKLYLKHTIYDGVRLAPDYRDVLDHVKKLWGYDVVMIESVKM